MPGSRLWAVLPLPEKEYLKDFTTPLSKREFSDLLWKAERVIPMPITKNREDGYVAAGRYVVQNSDLLVAIWDGNPAQGRAGTAEVIQLGREKGLSLAWIHAGNRLPGSNTPTSLGAEQGLVTYENFPIIGGKA